MKLEGPVTAASLFQCRAPQQHMDGNCRHKVVYYFIYMEMFLVQMTYGPNALVQSIYTQLNSPASIRDY